MPLPSRKIRLQFNSADNVLPNGNRLNSGMSAAAAQADTLWLAHDETVFVERLRVEATKAGSIRYARHRRFDLREFFALPASVANLRQRASIEADIEGLAIADGCLWITGSHSAVRDPLDGLTGRRAIAALANVRRAGNRFLLARIPIEPDSGGPALVPEVRLNEGRTLRAARLPGGRKNDALTRLLRKDPHLGPFLSLPSKDNGFDIEGLAVASGGRVFLGLRGPVIDGWACVLEIAVTAHSKRERELMLRRLRVAPARGAQGARYRKHFLDLEGAGIRDLCLAGRDLLILTGSPMRGKGKAHVRRWKNAIAAKDDSMVGRRKLPKLLELPYQEKKNHPEGMTIVAQRGKRVLLLVTYDSAERDARLGPAAMWTTLHTLELP